MHYTTPPNTLWHWTMFRTGLVRLAPSEESTYWQLAVTQFIVSMFRDTWLWLFSRSAIPCQPDLGMFGSGSSFYICFGKYRINLDPTRLGSDAVGFHWHSRAWAECGSVLSQCQWLWNSRYCSQWPVLQFCSTFSHHQHYTAVPAAECSVLSGSAIH